MLKGLKKYKDGASAYESKSNISLGFSYLPSSELTVIKKLAIRLSLGILGF